MAKKVILYIAMSLDGYIADCDGGVDWLNEWDSQGSYDEFIKGIGTIIMGYKTYEQIRTLSPHTWCYPNQHTYVITHQRLDNQPHLTFTSDFKTLLHRLKHNDDDSSKNGNIWICGGANLAQQVLRENFIDEIHISVIPKILGNGIGLFDTLPQSLSLTLLHTQTYGEIIELAYRVK